MTESTPRKRSRAACLSCQSRKRKCSGEQPCSTCAQAGVTCVFSDLPRKKRARSGSMYRASLSAVDERQRLPASDGWTHSIPPAKPASSAAGSAASPGSHPRVNDTRRMSHSLEVNSGAAFVRKLGLRIDPARAPRLHLFAWNVGERRLAPEASGYPGTSTSSSITSIISEDEMRRLAGIYFEKVHPCYAFLDRKTIFAHITQRWSASSISLAGPAEQSHDVVLLGVAAFGHLFSRREMSSVEIRIVDAARSLLEKSVLGADTPSVDTVTGWVLRAAYLRMTASPHAAWMASCTLMHLIEAAGLHLETQDPESAGLIQPTTSEAQLSNGTTTTTTQPLNDTNIRRRLFGMARHLNTWISFDLGRSRVVLHGATSSFPSTSTTHTDLYHLLPLSESLDPTGPTPQDLPELQASLTAVLDLIYTEPSLILVQTNLMLCIYRRVRALNAHAPLPGRALDRILALADRGLRAARSMVASSCPWHQVANVPFQVLCTLLAIDSRAALGLLPDAMATLREVLAAYDTAVMREAYSTAYLLIALHQRRKEDDTRALGEVLRANAAAAVPVPVPVAGSGTVAETQKPEGVARIEGSALGGDGDDVLTTTQTAMQTQARAQDVLGPVSDAELSWLGDLMIDMPSLQNFDLDQFLMTDVPWPLPEMGI